MASRRPLEGEGSKGGLAASDDEHVEGVAQSKTVKLVVVGTAGSGKSTLVNTLLAQPLCRTGTGQTSVTEDPTTNCLDLDGEGGAKFTVEIIDCPGFSGRRKNDDKVKQQLKNIESFHVLACCFDISSSGGRYRPMEHLKTLITLQELFGKECMKEKCIVVLTKGNLLFDQERMKKRSKVRNVVRDWKQEHQEGIDEEGGEAEGLQKIPIFVAGHATLDEKEKLRNHSKIDGSEEWYKTLWENIAKRSDPTLTEFLPGLKSQRKRTTSKKSTPKASSEVKARHMDSSRCCRLQ